MTSSTLRQAIQDINVGMGQIAAAMEPTRLRAVLGSCIAVTLHSRRGRAGAFAHVVLPDSAGRNDLPGKFADTAVPEMLRALARLGVPAEGLVARLAGGASMFGHEGPMQIGDANTQAVAESLRKAGIRVAGEDLGGRCGRRVTFDCATGQLTVEIVGQPPRVL